MCEYIYIYIYGGFLKIGVPPNHLYFSVISHEINQPANLGYPHCPSWKPPHLMARFDPHPSWMMMVTGDVFRTKNSDSVVTMLFDKKKRGS